MTDLVTLSGGTAVTNTLTIAGGTDNDHASVIKLVRTYLADLEEFGRVGFEIQTFATAGGNQQREYAELNEQQTTLLLTYMRNTDIVRFFKKRLVRAFFEMAQRLTKVSDTMAVLADPAAMRGLLLTYTEKVIELQHTVQQQAPKAAFHDQVVQSNHNHDLGEAAKLIGTGRTRLARWMREHRWINRRGEPYQDKIEAGLLDLKYSRPWTHPEKGEMRSVTTMVTGKGLTKLQRVFPAATPDMFTGPVLA